VLKGALARGLWEACGDLRRGAALGYVVDERHAAADEFPLLCRHFGAIRFLEARPVAKGSARPRAIPLSVAQAAIGDEKRWIDLASQTVPDGAQLAFQPDWKEKEWVEQRKEHGWAGVRFVEQVRTAINEQESTGSGRFKTNARRKAADGLLHAQRRVLPGEDEMASAVFRGGVVLPELSAADGAELLAELARAVSQVLTGLGKGHARVACRLEPSLAAPVAIAPGRWRLTLETPALLLDPVRVFALKNQELQPLYEQWLEGTGLRLLGRWCRQELRGGYLGRRFGPEGRYEPFLLESSGSCWLLEADAAGAATLERWLREGLPLPPWAQERYEARGAEAWQRCPFLPENGFGEIRLDAITNEEN